MAKFLKSNELNTGIETIIDEAKEILLIVSPFIKLHHRYKDCLKGKIDNHNLKIVLVFGKNENDYYKSMPKEEFDFFIQFPNIEIRYEERLHAKYYANESSSLLTSMNLYDYSQDNNIEAGIFLETKLINHFSNNKSLDEQAFDYFFKVSENSKLLYSKEPQFKKGMMGLKKIYDNSIVTENLIENIIKEKKQVVKIEQISDDGFCIRCGASIKLKPTVPYCKKCYESWKKYKNEEYQEKICHVCGNEAKTSLIKPTCYSCYRTYKNKLKFKLN